MATYLAGTFETQSLSSDSVDAHQKLNGSLPNSQIMTQDDLVYHQSSPLPSQSAPKKEDIEEAQGDNDPLLLSPRNACSPDSSSHGIEPWNSGRDTKLTVSLGSQSLTPTGDSGPSTSEVPENSSPLDTKPSASDCSDSWPLHDEEPETKLFSCSLDEEETETKPSVPVSPDWSIEITPSMVGSGLVNLGNTCFLNAVLQCFTHTVPFVKGVLSCNHTMPCQRNSEGFCLICTLRDHIELSLASRGKVLSPQKLVDNIHYFSSCFQRFQQEDAHEFLQCFLDRLDSFCNNSKAKDISFISQDHNFVKQVFGGRLVSKLRCFNCDHFSDTYEPLVDLSLEIGTASTLTGALESFTEVEKIEDPDMKFTCENCKEVVFVKKQFMLDQVPTIAAFHLKRFKNDGSFVEKIDKHMEFPLELNLFPYTSATHRNDVEMRYYLYAVVVHVGFSSTSGHYYCFIRSAPDTWYKLDDSKVARVQEDVVLSQKAYILFYANKSIPWFSSFMETYKPSIDSNISNTSPKSVLDNVEHICTPSALDVKEMSGAVDRICAESSCEGSVEVIQDKDDCTPLPHGANKSAEASHNVEKIICPSAIEQLVSSYALNESNYTQEFKEVKNNANFTPTPSGSPSPEIGRREPPVEVFAITRHHQALVEQVSSKRKLNMDLKDSKLKDAQKLLKKMPNSRASMLLAAMCESHDEGSQNKRSRRIKLSPHTNISPNTSHKSNLNPIMHPLTAGSFR